MNIPFLNSVNENIIIYNGELLPEDIRDTVTKSVLNLFDRCDSIYDHKIYRSPHCYWFILSKNISEYYILQSLSNVWSKGNNKNILRDAIATYPNILHNICVPSSINIYNLNFLFNLSNHLLETPDNTICTFDLLE